jgi:hypothetical protein
VDRSICRACAEICDACADSCDQLAGMEECAKVCRSCAKKLPRHGRREQVTMSGKPVSHPRQPSLRMRRGVPRCGLTSPENSPEHASVSVVTH